MQMKTVEPITVLFRRESLTIPQVGEYAARCGDMLLEEAKKLELAVAGPWTFVSYGLPRNGQDRFIIDFCLPVSDGERGTNGYCEIKQLSRFTCAYAMYEGSIENLFSTGYQPLAQQLEASGNRFTGESREVYQRWEGPNSPGNRIELQFGIGR